MFTLKAARGVHSQDSVHPSAMKSKPMKPAPCRAQDHWEENAGNTQTADVTQSCY